MLDVSALEDIVDGMVTKLSSKLQTETAALLSEIEVFLSETGMGETYFGKVVSGNSELVKRLRAGKRMWPETIEKAREYMKQKRGIEA